MYNVSQDYIDAMSGQIYRFYVRGGIVGEGTTVVFDGNNILQGSLSITNQCCDGDELKLGSVYAAELKVTFINLSAEIGQGMNVYIEEGIFFEDGSTTPEIVPMGNFVIAEAVKTRSGVEVTAFDYMSKFDRKFGLMDIVNKPYDWLFKACRQCGVTLGMTQAEVEALPNGLVNFQLYPENDISTYRDLLSWIAQALGTFATIDRLGNLKLVSFTQTPVFDVEPYARYAEDEFSLFETYYAGLKRDDLVNQIVVGYGDSSNDAYVYDIGANPFIQIGSAQTLEDMCVNILYELYAMHYVPFKITIPAGAPFDLGDILTIKGGRADATKKYCVMRYEWRYNGGMMLEGVGRCAELTIAQSKLDKDIKAVNSRQSTSGEIRYYSFTNANDISIANGEQKSIIDVRFMTNKMTTVIFQAEVLLTTTADTAGDAVQAKISYELNEIFESYHPVETWIESDKHILHLLYFISTSEETTNHFTVYLEATGGTVSILANNIIASVYGQGLSAEQGQWDGFLNFEDDVTEFALGERFDMVITGVASSEVATQTHTPHSRTYSENLSGIPIIGGIGIASMSDTLAVNKDPLTNLTWGEVGSYTWGQISDGYTW